MCRFIFYLGEPIPLDQLIARPANSLIHQSFHAEMRQPLNGDGFGIAWYSRRHGPEPAVFRAVTPAWNNQNLLHLSRVTESDCVLAHVRSASPGMPVNEANCHPFTYGPFAFMHNGGVAHFHRIKRAVVARLTDEAYHAVQGTTDSAHMFGLFLDAWFVSEEQDSLRRIGAAVSHTITEIEALLRQHGITDASQFNLAVSDGTHAVVCRHAVGEDATAPSLWWHEGAQYHVQDGKPRMRHRHAAAEDTGPETVIVASEPLTDDPGWREVPSGKLVLIGADRRAQLRALPSHHHADGDAENSLEEAVSRFYRIDTTQMHTPAPPAPETASGDEPVLTHYRGPATEPAHSKPKGHRHD